MLNKTKFAKQIKSAIMATTLVATGFTGLNYGISKSVHLGALSPIVPSSFSMCGSSCSYDTEYYVGYNRTNKAMLNNESMIFPSAPDKIYTQVSDYRSRETAMNIDTQTVTSGEDLVDSIHRLENIKIGSLRKSEIQRVNTLQPNSSAEATVKLLWGDTITITSDNLPIGTPVALRINQIGGGFGDPVTINAAYNGTMRTYINGLANPDLFYQIVKLPGTNDYTEFGNFNSVDVITVNVGDKIKIESKLEVTDQVFVGEDNQELNGADAIDHKINVLTPGASYTLASQTNLVDNAITEISVPDYDNISNSVENDSPNIGDSNNDGIKDAMQGNVATLLDKSTNPKYVTVSTDPTSPCQTLSSASTNFESANNVIDSNYEYPSGLIDFTAPCFTNLKLKTYWYGLDTTKNYNLRKFNSNNGSYSDVPGVISAVENMNNIPVWTFSYTVADNGPLDTNPTIGSITDPVGPAIVTPSIANSGSGSTITISNSQSSNSSSSLSSSSVSSTNTTNVSSSILNLSTSNETKNNSIEKLDKIDDRGSLNNTESPFEGITLPRTGGSKPFAISNFALFFLLLICVKSFTSKID